MANQDRVNFVWAESALTTIPPIPVSEVAYRDTTQTPEQMEVGQQYDTIYNSARHNQLLFLLTSVAKTLCENGIMPFLAGQEYSQYARCIFTDGKLYTASRAILANEQPYPTPGDDSGVWIAEETSENLVPNSRRVIAGTGLTGGGPLSSDVTLSAKLDGKTTRAAAGGAITVKDVAIGGDLGDLASARGQIGPARELGNNVDFNTVTEAGLYLINATGSVNAPRGNQAFFLQVVRSVKGAITKNLLQIAYNYSSVADLVFIRQYRTASSSWSVWTQLITSSQVGDGLTVNNGIISVPKYKGATASAAGKSGLVPPAAAGQHESFLTGGGEYKPALSFTPVQQGGGAGQDNSKIYIGGSPEGLRVQMGATDLGNIVTTRAGITKAIRAATADTAHGIGTHPWFDSLDQGGNPTWVMGLATDGSNKLRPFDPAVLRVNYAASANSVAVIPNVAFVGRGGAIPNGGTWLYIYMPYDSHYLRGVTLAGGAATPSNDGGIAIRTA